MAESEGFPSSSPSAPAENSLLLNLPSPRGLREDQMRPIYRGRNNRRLVGSDAVKGCRNV